MVLFSHVHDSCSSSHFHFCFYFPLFFPFYPLPPSLLWSPVVQCGFFKRNEPRRHYETEYYRAHLGVQPSEVEKQVSEL